jgi:hypothetical protein
MPLLKILCNVEGRRGKKQNKKLTLLLATLYKNRVVKRAMPSFKNISPFPIQGEGD